MSHPQRLRLTIPIKYFFRGAARGLSDDGSFGSFFLFLYRPHLFGTRYRNKKSEKLSPHDFSHFKGQQHWSALLALTYVGFSFTAAFNSHSLEGIPKDQLLGHVAILILGKYAGVIACVAAALACLTTAIALAAVFAEFVHKDISDNKISYNAALIGTLIVSYFVSTLNFTGIAQFLTPILQVCYPALIVLCILNILHKIWHVQVVKLPVFLVFLASLGAYLLSMV